MKKKTVPIPLPSQVSLLVEAINCDNEDAARLLVNRALSIIYGDQEITKKDADAAIALIRGLEPKDTTELHLAAQFVACNLHGMALMASNYINNKGHGMMLIRLSLASLDMLIKYRDKSPINVTNEDLTLINTLVTCGNKKTADTP